MTQDMDRKKMIEVYIDLVMRLQAELNEENDLNRLHIKELKLK